MLRAVVHRHGVGRTASSAWAQSRPLAALGLAAVGTAGACIASDVRHLYRTEPHRRITPYKAPQYWLDYRDGFVRRAFPGAVLSALTRGTPTLRQVTTTGVGLSLTAAAAVVPLAVQAARRAPDDLGSLLVAGAVVSSPLTASMLLQDVGRFDAVGVLALAAVSCPTATWDRMPCSAGAPALAALLAVAAATQEFMLGPLAPLAVVRARSLAARCGRGPAGTALLLTGVLAPAAAITVASAVLPPPATVAEAARRRARGQGVGPPGDFGDALSAVERDVVANRAFFEHFERSAVARALVLWVGVFAVTVVVLARLWGLAASRRYWSQVAYQAGVAVALSLLGADFRRWWGLGLLGLVGVVTAGPEDGAPGTSPRRPAGPRYAAGAVAALAALNVRVRRLTVYPVPRTAATQGRS